MNFSTVANIATIILCAAVLVQSVRMMRSLKAVRGGAIADVVEALDRSTGQARMVLSELRDALGECAHSARAVAEGKAIADELTVMIGIANASADRMADAADAARRQQTGDYSAADHNAGGWA
ncbi:DUF6468 domain-containing protein [Sphingomonas sp. PP-CE-1G-424]|uniref:DUF6468 domain-containing protein n=1 Tax=Sphingomonas sp. PP-CE-1G-424 TaxID=2135658 RepID=UPI0010F22770|nr:DUF6468 domain-containing protein [Sphingomonas sp. PP-CE-1G-424]TCP72407.1 hypothetical protein C8J43_101145 [Sphingomonas sp. PP-CE-1G-424]